MDARAVVSSKLDELMPSYNVGARYATLVHASLSDTVRAFDSADFSRLPLTRLLMALRTLGRMRDECHRGGSQLERLQQAGFVVVANVRQEIVLGTVGRFWKFNSNIIKGLTAEEIIEFQRDGYAKAYWNVTFVPESEGSTRVATETRVQTFGNSATRKFRAYWLVVGLFSGVIRREMLRLIKRHAETTSGP
jgi:hypothetical protein